MKLQVNDSGSWRHMFTFDKTVEQAVRSRAVKLMVIVHERTKLRILDDNNDVRAYCTGPNFTWESCGDRRREKAKHKASCARTGQAETCPCQSATSAV